MDINIGWNIRNMEINKMRILDLGAISLGLSASTFNDGAQACFYVLSCVSLAYSIYLKRKNKNGHE